MGEAISIAVGTAFGDEANQGAVSETVRIEIIQMVNQSEIISMVAGGLTKSDKRVSFIATFMAKTVM